jgi:hypothetical protein
MMIKSKDFAFVGLRVLGIYVFIKGGQMLVQSFAVLAEIKDTTYTTDAITYATAVIITNIAFSVILLIIAGLLLGATGKVTGLLLPAKKEMDSNADNLDLNEADRDNSISLAQLQTAAFAVVGLVILTTAVTDAFKVISDLIKLQFEMLPTKFYFDACRVVIYLLAGIYLLFGIRNFLELMGSGLSKLRGGISKLRGEQPFTEEEEDDESNEQTRPS